MKTEHILPTLGAFTIGFFLSSLIFALIFIPQYQRVVNKYHYSEQVIQDCIDIYPDFYDTVAEGDAWSNYVTYNQ